MLCAGGTVLYPIDKQPLVLPVTAGDAAELPSRFTGGDTKALVKIMSSLRPQMKREQPNWGWNGAERMLRLPGANPFLAREQEVPFFFRAAQQELGTSASDPCRFTIYQ